MTIGSDLAAARCAYLRRLKFDLDQIQDRRTRPIVNDGWSSAKQAPALAPVL
jgi:hypothetical protein